MDLEENRKGTRGQCGVLWPLNTSIVSLDRGEKKLLKSLAKSFPLFYLLDVRFLRWWFSCRFFCFEVVFCNRLGWRSEDVHNTDGNKWQKNITGV